MSGDTNIWHSKLQFPIEQLRDAQIEVKIGDGEWQSARLLVTDHADTPSLHVVTVEIRTIDLMARGRDARLLVDLHESELFSLSVYPSAESTPRFRLLLAASCLVGVLPLPLPSDD